MRLGYLHNIFLSLLSSSLLVLSFPTFDLGLLAWVGLLPLLIAINGKKLSYAFFYSLFSGMVFFVGLFRWILAIPNFTLVQQILLTLYLGLYFGLFGLALNFISGRWSIMAGLWAAPFLWVSLEYLRSNFSFLALPWGLLAHSQYQYPMVIQLASLFGTYSISFMIVLANCALAGLFLPTLHLSKPGGKKFRGALVATAAAFTGLALLYGYWIISQPIGGKRLKVSVVQGNIPQSEKWDWRYARKIMEIYANLTQEAAQGHPALIVWPETAVPGAINQDIGLQREVDNISKKAGTYLLLGSAHHQKFAGREDQELKYLNSAYLMSPDPEIAKHQRYDKIRLFPFGEYLPFREVIPWSYIGVANISEYVSGREFTVFQIPGSRFGVTICWEDVFPDLFRGFVRRGAQFMINITNEARFGKSPAPYQLVSIAIFRAVENRIFVVRCSNTGVSCIIDPYGRIIERVRDQNGQDIFVCGVGSGWVSPLNSRTIYSQYGDLLAWVCLVWSGVFLLVLWWKGIGF